LGWTPRTTFVELVREMVTEDDAIATKDALVRKHGYPTFNYHEA
jgi:GDPmannose 4,6-dehydratase